MRKILLIVMSLCAINLSFAQDWDNMWSQARELREHIMADPYRPIYHFTAPEGICDPFDPNGAIFWNGKYHLGYIYQKMRDGKREHVWGHAVSTDLFHWTIYPDFLNVKDGDLERGIFSGGSFISREGIPFVSYHGEGAGANMLAYSTDKDLRTWKKYEHNPIVKNGAWDPEVWYDKKTDYYYHINGGHQAGLFKSKDMINWEHTGLLIDKEDRLNNDFEDFSCSDFFTIGDKDVLLFISHYLGTQYYIGKFENDKFIIDSHGRMNWPGGTFFAPEEMKDDKGRNIVFGWVLERRPHYAGFYGWSGIMSLPRVLTLDKNGQMQINPPEEISLIRLNQLKEDNFSLKANEEKTLSASGTSMEIQLEITDIKDAIAGVKVFADADNKEYTSIYYDPNAKELVIDFEKSSLEQPVKMPSYCVRHFEPKEEERKPDVSSQHTPFELEKGESLKLNIFIDKCMIEVFANGRQCVTQVVYPKLRTSDKVKVFSTDDSIKIKNIQSYEIAPTTIY